MNENNVKKSKEKKITEKIWEIDLKDKRAGTWWWWFWVFFIENKNNKGLPQQLMILWSTKNEKEINCNDRLLKINTEINVHKNKSFFDGTAAAWFFDGKKMHENFILEQGEITLTKKPASLISNSKNKTSFYEEKDKFIVKINKEDNKFVFNLKLEDNNKFVAPIIKKSSYFRGAFGHEVLRIPRLSFTGAIKNKEKKQNINGTAYFQKVIVNAPVSPWYWGIFHFNKGSILSYFNPHIGTAVLKDNLTKKLLSKGNISVKQTAYFFDKKTMKRYDFEKIKIKKETNKQNQPVFKVSAENKDFKLLFTVDCYADAFWKFEKKFLGLIRMRLKYNEYPAKIIQFSLQDKQGNQLVTIKDLGIGIGNAEHSWGALI